MPVTRKQTCLVLRRSLAYIVFLALGAAVFMILEEQETPERSDDLAFLAGWTEGDEKAWEEAAMAWEKLASVCNSSQLRERSFADFQSSNNDTRLMVVKELRRACKDTETLESPVVSLGFFPYLYFTLTVVTTIGYGNVIPRSTGGRLFCMVYALIGIPLTGMLLAALGDAFSGFMLRHFESKIISRFGRHKRYGVAVATVAYLMIGFVLFLFVPAGIFTVIEGWTYLEALYYAVVTLTTIGFGDFVTAQEGDASWLWFYQVAVIVWIVMGLGYWVTVVTFTTKALRKLHLPDVNAQARMALQQLGILSRDPEFLRKHSIVTMEMMAQLASAVTGERVAGPSENTVASAGVAGAFARGQGAGLPSLFRLPIGGSSPVGGAYQPAPREDDEEGNRGESEREPL